MTKKCYDNKHFHKLISPTFITSLIFLSLCYSRIFQFQILLYNLLKYDFFAEFLRIWFVDRTHNDQNKIPSMAFVNLLNAELKSICYLLALLGAHHFLHVSRIRVKISPIPNFIQIGRLGINTERPLHAY